MYFGLIKTTSGWYRGPSALRQFSAYALVTLLVWTCFLFLHYRPLLLQEVRATSIGGFVIVLSGIALAFSCLGLTFGMAWYFWKLDTSESWVKFIWIALALCLSPYAEVAYFVFVYRKNVLNGAPDDTERVASP